MTELPRGLGAPATRALAVAGVERLEDLPGWTEAAVLGLHGVGPKGVSVLRQALADHGMRFARAQPGHVRAGGLGTGGPARHT